MKFGIKKTIIPAKTNINGKPLEQIVEYSVYRKLFFGLFRTYIKFRPVSIFADEITVSYVPQLYATTFDELEEAELFIQKMQTVPDKFVRKIWKANSPSTL